VEILADCAVAKQLNIKKILTDLKRNIAAATRSEEIELIYKLEDQVDELTNAGHFTEAKELLLGAHGISGLLFDGHMTLCFVMSSLNEWDAALHWLYQSLLFVWKIKNPDVPKNKQIIVNRAATWITYSLVISKKSVQVSVAGEEHFQPKHAQILSSLLSKARKKLEVHSCGTTITTPCLPSDMIAKMGAQIQDFTSQVIQDPVHRMNENKCKV